MLSIEKDETDYAPTVQADGTKRNPRLGTLIPEEGIL